MNDDETTTGLPIFRTWGSVYGLVLVNFAVCVGLLILLAGLFQ
jgi:hypothetical protein